MNKTIFDVPFRTNNTNHYYLLALGVRLRRCKLKPLARALHAGAGSRQDSQTPGGRGVCDRPGLNKAALPELTNSRWPNSVAMACAVCGSAAADWRAPGPLLPETRPCCVTMQQSRCNTVPALESSNSTLTSFFGEKHAFYCPQLTSFSERTNRATGTVPLH